MPRRFTMDRLIDLAKSQADMENSDQIPDSQWRELLSSAYAELYSVILGAGGRYFEEVYNFSSSQLVSEEDGDAGRIPLPDDIMSVIGVDRRESNRWVRIVELMMQERNAFTGSSGARGRAFALKDNDLYIYPRPTNAQDYRVVYIPQPCDFGILTDNDGDVVVDVVTPDGEKFLVWNMAFHALAKKEEEGERLAQAMMERYLGRVQEWAWKRMLTEPRRRVVHEGPSFDLQDGLDEGGWSWGR